MTEDIIRVSISEASRLFGVDQKTIRRAIQHNDIKYIVVRGRYKIHFESLLKWSQQRSTLRNKMQIKGIGQYVDKWKIKNTLFSPNPQNIQKKNDPRTDKIVSK